MHKRQMQEHKQLAELAEQCNSAIQNWYPLRGTHISHFANDELMKIKDQAMGFGVEGLFDPNRGIDIIYINPGEEYVETVIWDGKEKKFHIGCLIDYLEREGETQMFEINEWDALREEYEEAK